MPTQLRNPGKNVGHSGLSNFNIVFFFFILKVIYYFFHFLYRGYEIMNSQAKHWQEKKYEKKDKKI